MTGNIFRRSVIDGIDDKYINEAANIMYKSVRRSSRTIEVDFAGVKAAEKSPAGLEKMRGLLYAAAAVALIVGAVFLTRFIIDSSRIKVQQPNTLPASTDSGNNENNSVSGILPEYSKVFDTYDWGDRDTPSDFTMPEYPDVTFTCDNNTELKANGEYIFYGYPMINLYLSDITGDGKRDICFTSSYGSGIVDLRVYAYDYDKKTLYCLSDRGRYDYLLTQKDGALCLKKYDYPFGNTYDALEKGEELQLTLSMMTPVDEIEGGITRRDMLTEYNAVYPDKDYEELSQILGELPAEAAEVFKKAWKISMDMAYPASLIKKDENGHITYIATSGSYSCYETGILYESFMNALSDTFTLAGAQKMLDTYSSFTWLNYGLAVEEPTEMPTSDGGVKAYYELAENTGSRIEVVRKGSGDTQHASFVLINDGSGWKAEAFMQPRPQDGDNYVLTGKKLIEWGQPYVILDNEREKFDFVKQVGGLWYSFLALDNSEYTDIIRNEYKLGSVEFVGENSFPSANGETTFPQNGTLYSNRNNNYFVEDERTVLVTNPTKEDYEYFRANFNSVMNEKFFLTEVMMVIPCERVPESGVKTFFEGYPDVISRGEPPSPLTDFPKEFYNEYSAAPSRIHSLVYDWRETDKTDTKGSANIGSFLEELSDPELTAAYYKAALTLSIFDTEAPALPDTARRSEIHVRSDDGMSYKTYYSTGCTYESFYNTLLGAFTAETADKLLKEQKAFCEYDGALWYNSGLSEYGLSDTVIYNEYRLVSKTDSAVEFVRVRYEPANWAEWSPDMIFDRGRIGEYKERLTEYRFVKTENGWRAEKFGNSADGNKILSY